MVSKIKRVQEEMSRLESDSSNANALSRQLNQQQRNVRALQQHASNRFLFALPLNALQLAMVDKVQIVGLKIEQRLIQTDAVKPAPGNPGHSAQTKEQITLVITAKNYGNAQTEEKFIDRIATVDYFASTLRSEEPVLLKTRLPKQVDPLDPSKSFTLFTVECVYPERALGND